MPVAETRVGGRIRVHRMDAGRSLNSMVATDAWPILPHGESALSRNLIPGCGHRDGDARLARVESKRHGAAGSHAARDQEVDLRQTSDLSGRRADILQVV